MTSGPSSRDRRRGHTLDQLCCRPRRCAAAIVPDVESGGHPSTVRDAADAIRVAFDHQCPLCWSRPGVGVFIRAAPSSEVQSHVDDHVPLAVDVAELAASAEDVVSLRGTLGEEGGMSRRRLPNPGRWHCGPSWASVGGRARGPPRRRRDQRRPVPCRHRACRRRRQAPRSGSCPRRRRGRTASRRYSGRQPPAR